MKTPAHDLFAQALEIERAARGAFLARACRGNAELRLEVQRLLVEAELADSFFADTDGATLGAEEFQETHSEKPGGQIGPYKLRQRIGEGGFGTVWMAEQSVPISRMVALKVIKAGMDTKQVLARFEAERQALAMMDHPHIAKVLDAGATPTGRPWFAMELVKGIPITAYCDQAGLGTRERLDLFRDVCAAINHAHQKGIIHRDIKPSNVMVTLHGDKPVVKVIDFGIAKATQGKLTDQTLFTRFEQLIGTPVYMSPEQAALSGLDIDTRSDIYALGVLLYELLTGKPPFDPRTLLAAGYDEMRRIIREV
jgi:serine/threonine protein kinase